MPALAGTPPAAQPVRAGPRAEMSRWCGAGRHSTGERPAPERLALSNRCRRGGGAAVLTGYFGVHIGRSCLRAAWRNDAPPTRQVLYWVPPEFLHSRRARRKSRHRKPVASCVGARLLGISSGVSYPLRQAVTASLARGAAALRSEAAAEAADRLLKTRERQPARGRLERIRARSPREGRRRGLEISSLLSGRYPRLCPAARTGCPVYNRRRQRWLLTI